MERKILIPLIAAIILVLAAAILLPGGRKVDEHPRLPWMVEVDTDGTLKVFDISLGRTTLAETRNILKDDGETSLFRNAEGKLSLETFFPQVYLSGIRAELVAACQVEPQVLAQMFERGVRVNTMGNGVKKITLADADLAQAALLPVESITYLPKARLDAELLTQRFGPPERRITESSGVVHWIYPKKGLDLALNPEGKVVMQYVNPGRFQTILEPLEKAH